MSPGLYATPSCLVCCVCIETLPDILSASRCGEDEMVAWRESVYGAIDPIKKLYPKCSRYLPNTEKVVPTWWEEIRVWQKMHKIHLLARLQQRNTTLGHLNWPVRSTFLNHASINWFKWKLFVLLDQVNKPETFTYTYFILILYLPICISPPPRGQFTCGPNFLLWLNKNIQGFLKPFIDPITHSHSFVITHSQLWGLLLF